MTPIEKRRHLNKLGFIFYAHKIKDLYYATVWQDEKYITIGKIGYKNRLDCDIQTESVFYKKYKHIINNNAK